jgi:hypothetical protein
MRTFPGRVLTASTWRYAHLTPTKETGMKYMLQILFRGVLDERSILTTELAR